MVINQLKMVIEITSGMTKLEIEKKLSDLKPKKQFDSYKYLGKVKWDKDPLEYQKRLRNEWE